LVDEEIVFKSNAVWGETYRRHETWSHWRYNKKIYKIDNYRTFEHLKSLIEAQVKKMDTQFREAISVTERLAINLRFLATGDSYIIL
jgi:hypothetical protein